MNIGTNIFNLRRERNITQAYLAEKLGVSVQSVSKWENEQCAPDVSIIPTIAEFFGVSIDRIFGYDMNSYHDEVKKIIKAADDSCDTYKEIEICENGLKKYPNSNELRIYLAFSLSMVNRISKDEAQKRSAVERAVKLCNEVVDTCGDIRQVDKAFIMLTRIYNETGQYGKAQDCIEKISADRYEFSTLATLNLLNGKRCFVEGERHAQKTLWKMFWSMSHIFESMRNTFIENKEYEKALDWFDAHEKLLSIFDRGCPDYYATYKIDACRAKARLYMSMGDREKCLSELRRYAELAVQVKKVGEDGNTIVALRNPMYFSHLTDDEYAEEYMTAIYPESFIDSFDGFFGDDAEYIVFKKSLSE